MKKTISINTYIVKYSFIAILIPLSFFFILNNFGDFSVFYYGGKQPHKTPAEEIYYTTPIGTKVQTDGNGYSYTDVLMKGEVFQEDYSVKLPYVLKTLYKDSPYILFVSIVIFLILIFRKKFELRMDRDADNTDRNNLQPVKENLENPIENDDLSQTIAYLKKLKKEGILTDLEFENKIQKVEDERRNNYKQSSDYLKLKELHEKGYLTAEEFEHKGQLLIDKFFR